MDIREALMELEACEARIRNTKTEDAAAKNTGVRNAGTWNEFRRFETPGGEVFERRDDKSFIQRNTRFPKNLITDSGQVTAFATPYHDRCVVLMGNGLEDRTILDQWAKINRNPLCTVEHPVMEIVPMRDQVRLATDIYLPSGTKRVPTALVRIPYGRTVDTSCYFHSVQRGYAVVVQDVRGRRDSEDEWLPMYYKVEDGDDTLSWIARQPWSNDNAGMTRGSYLEYVQWAAAASENPHLKTIPGSICAGNPFVDVPRQGGCFNSGTLTWAFLVSGQHSNPLLMARDGRKEVLDIRPLEELAPKALEYDIPFLRRWFSHVSYDKLWQQENWRGETNAHRVPALIMSGWFDDSETGTTEALELYHNYQKKRAILGPWMHTGNTDYDVHGSALRTNALRYDMDLICLAWLEHYLKGVDSGIDHTPKVKYCTMGSNQWKVADDQPVPGTGALTFYLGGDQEDIATVNRGILSVSAPASPSWGSYKYDPEHPALRLMDMSGDELEVPAGYSLGEKRPDILCYSTQTLSSDLTITGDVTAELYLSSDCEGTDPAVCITDVDREGRSMKLTDNILSVWYRNQLEHPDFMESGQIYPAKIRIIELFHASCKGHCLRVTVTSSAKNFIFPNRNIRDGFGSVTIKTAHNRIHRGGVHVSRVMFRQEMWQSVLRGFRFLWLSN